jgi:hypothetical protein
LLPRPGDLVKAWIFPLAFGLGALTTDGVTARDLLRAAVIWVALELLIYQARYQWNDIRGFEADQRHPDRAARGRLPGPPSRGGEHRMASAAVATGRLATAAWLALLLAPLDLAAPLAVLVGAVFAVAVLYELLRTRCTGDSDRVPPPLSGGIFAIWMVVGGGYAIRGLAGLGAAVDLLGEPALLGSALLAFWSFGIAFVTGRWALEALAFGRRGARGGIVWEASPGQAREHLLALVRWLPATAPAAAAGPGGSLAEWRALAEGGSLRAPWNLAALVAAAAAAVSGALLAGPASAVDAGLAAALGTLAAALAFRGRRPALTALAAVALGGAFALAGHSRPGLAILPWLLIVAAHLFFTAQSPRTLAHPLRFALARFLPSNRGPLASTDRRLGTVSPLLRK